MRPSWQRLAALLFCLLLACCRCAFALDPSLDVNQYAHTAWRVRDGFSKGAIYSIVQTPDGYIWLGTGFGLLRFDGVRNLEWQPPQGQHLPSNTIYSLLAAQDGTLWIGTVNGLVSWKDGKLTQYSELAGQVIYSLLEDREGTVWVGVGSPSPGRLCAIQNGGLGCSGEDGSFGVGIRKLYRDIKGNLWVLTHTGLWRWKPGKPQYYPLAAGTGGPVSLIENGDDSILVGTHNGIQRIAAGRIVPYLLPGVSQRLNIRTLLRDHDGGLWIATFDRGILHVHAGRTEAFAAVDGLSGDTVNDLFEDREGNVWVATVNGLDRFRQFAVATLTTTQGLSNSNVQSLLADRGGSIWLSTAGGLDRWKDKAIASFDKRNGKLDGLPPFSVFEDRGGRIWVATRREFGYVEDDRFVPVSGVPGGAVSMAEDSTGDLWVANQDAGLIRLREEHASQQIPWSGLGHKDFATALATDTKGGLWLGFLDGGIAYLAGGAIRSSFTSMDGLAEGRINNIRAGPDSTLWVAAEGGLSRLKNARIATLAGKNGLPCDTVHWSMEDDDHSFWLYMPCGLVRIARPEMDAWITATDQDKNARHNVQFTVFDSSDGARPLPVVGVGSQVAKSQDGKLWFLPWDGVSVIDPRHIPVNELPPPVHIEQIAADRETYDAVAHVQIPPLTRELEIDYTALSFAAPEKVFFRYKLEGFDRDWRQAGTRRQAFYTNLPPRSYRFRVVACNNSGIWNEQGATLDFSIAPAYYQTAWFELLCVAVVLALLWSAYQLRQRQLQQQFSMRLETRVNERTRIARELHDTLLQSFHGLMFRLQAVRNMLPGRPEDAGQALDGAITRAEQAIVEGRGAIQDLRSAPGADLTESLTVLGEDLGWRNGDQDAPRFQLIVEGVRRRLSPVFRDEVYRIGRELLQNAFQHAHAREIEAEIRYERRAFRLLIRDDGKGIDPKVLEQGGRPGHWGLPGVRERAQQIGAQVDFWSEVGAGTEVQLTVPGNIAYEQAKGNSRFWWFGKKM